MQKSLKKYFLLFIFINLLPFNLFATEKNSISCGGVFYGKLYLTENEPFFSTMPCFSYERLLKTFSNSSSLSSELSFLLNPFDKIYSFSANFKMYTKEFEGLFFGFSPLSEINFANLFTEEPYLNFGIGQMIGMKGIVYEKFSLELKLVSVVPFFDKDTKFMGLFMASLGFLW